MKLLCFIFTLSNLLFSQEAIAILDFDAKGVSQQEADAITESFTTLFFRLIENDFVLIERQQVSEILEEQGLQMSGLIASSSAVRIGNALGAQYLVYGTVMKVGSTYSITARIFSVETTEITNAAIFHHRGEIDALLTEGVEQVAHSLLEKNSVSKPEQVLWDPARPFEKPMSKYTMSQVKTEISEYIDFDTNTSDRASDTFKFEKNQKLKRLKSMLEEIQTREPANPEVWYLLGQVLREQDRSSTGAVDPFTKPQLQRAQVHSSYFLNVIELDPYFNIDVFDDIEMFARVSPYSRVIAEWGTLAYSYHRAGNVDSSRFAYAQAVDLGVYVPFLTEMARNMLMSCEKNAILITNGDDDTYPLWYLQQYENYRRDVLVVNKGLLSVSWYVKDLVNERAKNSGLEHNSLLTINDEQIDKVASRLMLWKTKKVTVSAPINSKNKDGHIEFLLKPTYADSTLRPSDLFLLRIINNLEWKYPLYMAITIPSNGRLGLEDYLQLEGLVYRLMPFSVSDKNNVDIEVLKKNLDSYYYSAMRNPISATSAYAKFANNYRSLYLQLSANYYMKYRDLKREKADSAQVEEERQMVVAILDRMAENIPEEWIPMTFKELYYRVGRIYGEAGDKERLKQVLDRLMERGDLTPSDKIEYGQSYASVLEDLERSREIFEDLYHTYKTYETAVQTQGFAGSGIDQESWEHWQQHYSKIVSSLVHTYMNMELFEDAEVVLTSWLDENPEDPVALSQLKEIREKRQP